MCLMKKYSYYVDIQCLLITDLLQCVDEKVFQLRGYLISGNQESAIMCFKKNIQITWWSMPDNQKSV